MNPWSTQKTTVSWLMSMTLKVMLNWWGPIQIGRSTTPITFLREPSKSRTISALVLILGPLNCNWLNVAFGITLSEAPVLTRTRDRRESIHMTEICSALLWAFPSGGDSASLNPKYLMAVICATTSSNWSTVISCITWAVFRNFNNALQWASELSSKDKMEILEGVWPN